MTAAQARTASVEFCNITKSFGEHKVLTGVNTQAYPGDVIALMGENGAGKSTLMRILSGVYDADSFSGELKVNGELRKFNNVRDGKHAGIAMIHQELGLFPELTVAEYILLEELSGFDSISIPWADLFKRCQDFLNSLGFSVDARKKISELSTGAAQLVEIARAIRTKAQILIMDEPTSALTSKETDALFVLIRKLQAEGKTIFYVSHRMEEIRMICNRVVVLRDGIIAGSGNTSELTQEKLIQWMVGREVNQIYPPRVNSQNSKKKVLAIQNLSVTHTETKKPLIQNSSFDLHAGEILGLGGLMGAGRSELLLAVFGFFTKKNPLGNQFIISGDLEFDGVRLDPNEGSPAFALNHQVAMLTEDRKGLGLFLNRPASENMTISAIKRESSYLGGVIDAQKEQSTIQSLNLRLKIRGPSLKDNVETYSGGNQQKVYLSKCLAIKPKILILDEPTRGVDIGAKIEIYNLMRELVAQDVAILLISSEMPELLGMSDRVLVMKNGEIKKEFDTPEKFIPEEILKAASL